MEPSVTMNDVARKAGVSAITVSRAFAGTAPVAGPTRQRILAAAEELGYVPHLLARGLARGRSTMIGVLVNELSNPFYTPPIDAIQAVAHDKNYMLVIAQSLRQPAVEIECVRQFREIRVAGLIVVPVAPQSDHLVHLRSQGTAVVAMSRVWPQGDYVAVDDVAGGHMAGEHLVQLGHQHIGCLALDDPTHSGIRARVQGLRQENGLQAADAFLALSEPPAAVFVTSDRLAMGFMQGLLNKGVRIPDDIAIVGYDDILYAEVLSVPLTTIALPKYEMGQRAAQILFDRIEHGATADDLRQVLLPPQLVVRASSGGRTPLLSPQEIVEGFLV